MSIHFWRLHCIGSREMQMTRRRGNAPVADRCTCSYRMSPDIGGPVGVAGTTKQRVRRIFEFTMSRMHISTHRELQDITHRCAEDFMRLASTAWRSSGRAKRLLTCIGNTRDPFNVPLLKQLVQTNSSAIMSHIWPSRGCSMQRTCKN